jgi:hypothetical protein
MPNGLPGRGHFAAKMVPFFAATDIRVRSWNKFGSDWPPDSELY